MDQETGIQKKEPDLKPGEQRAARLSEGIHKVKVCYTYNYYLLFGSVFDDEWREGNCGSDSFLVLSDLVWNVYAENGWIIDYK